MSSGYNFLPYLKKIFKKKLNFKKNPPDLKSLKINASRKNTKQLINSLSDNFKIARRISERRLKLLDCANYKLFLQRTHVRNKFFTD